MWILVVEDELPMARILRKGLENQNHTVTVAVDGAEALEVASSTKFDAVVLDVMLPAVNGLSVAQRLRKSGNHVPILMLTARDAPEDIIRGLDAGADDYLVKPFAFNVLLARLRALSRRASNPVVSVLRVNDLTLDPASREVKRGGRRVDLTATEFRFLEHLMRCAGRVASRSSIINAVWGFEQEIENNTVDNTSGFCAKKSILILVPGLSTPFGDTGTCCGSAPENTEQGRSIDPIPPDGMVCGNHARNLYVRARGPFPGGPERSRRNH